MRGCDVENSISGREGVVWLCLVNLVKSVLS